MYETTIKYHKKIFSKIMIIHKNPKQEFCLLPSFSKNFDKDNIHIIYFL